MNLLNNPSAEAQPVTFFGWTAVSGNWTAVLANTPGDLRPRSGDYLFWGGQSASAELYQDVDLSTYQAWIGAGQHAALFVGYVGSSPADSDTARVIVEVRDATGNIVQSRDSGTINADVWKRVEVKVPVPEGSASIRVRLLSQRLTGSDNNGYFDDVGLYLPPPNLLLDPGAEQQPVTSHGWVSIFGDWSQARGNDAGGIGTHSGQNFFWAGQSAEGLLCQLVDLSAYRGWLGDGLKFAYAAGYVGTYSGDQDTSLIVVHVYDDSNTIIYQTPQTLYNVDFWSLLEFKVPLPATAAKIDMCLVAHRASGSDNNGYFDDLGIYLPAFNLLQDPGAELQPVTGNGWVETNGDWSQPRNNDSGGIGTHSGSNFFWAGQSATGQLYQVLNIFSYLGLIGNGAERAHLIGYKGSWSGDADTAQISLMQEKPDLTVTEQSDTPSSPDFWTRSEVRAPLLPDASFVSANLKSTRVTGSDNNGYFDDLHAQIEIPAWTFDADTIFADDLEEGD